MADGSRHSDRGYFGGDANIDGELYVLAKSEGRRAKEMAIRRKKLARLLRKLRAMRRSCPKRDQLLMRVGAVKTDVGRAFGFVKIHLPEAGQEVKRETFTFHLDKAKLKEAELQDGHYLLRTNLVAEDPAVLWDRYMQLTQIEATFKCLKSDLGIRPIYHQLEHRVEAHILVAFLAYCLRVTLKHRLRAHAPGLTPGRCWRSWPVFRCWMCLSRLRMAAGWSCRVIPSRILSRHFCCIS
jgi:transposase